MYIHVCTYIHARLYTKHIYYTNVHVHVHGCVPKQIFQWNCRYPFGVSPHTQTLQLWTSPEKWQLGSIMYMYIYRLHVSTCTYMYIHVCTQQPQVAHTAPQADSYIINTEWDWDERWVLEISLRKCNYTYMYVYVHVHVHGVYVYMYVLIGI